MTFVLRQGRLDLDSQMLLIDADRKVVQRVAPQARDPSEFAEQERRTMERGLPDVQITIELGSVEIDFIDDGGDSAGALKRRAQ